MSDECPAFNTRVQYRGPAVRQRYLTVPSFVQFCSLGPTIWKLVARHDHGLVCQKEIAVYTQQEAYEETLLSE